jgi:amidase/aspartyl-tRNA(Asn)/glutamyl-tRNA(Gln) amidotransferase subunit A
VEEVDLHIPRVDIQRATGIHFALGFAAWIASEAKVHGDLMTPYALEMARWADQRGQGGTMLEKLEIEGNLYPRLGLLLERYDALICPTVGTRGLIAGDDYVDHGLEVGGEQLELYFESILTPIFNVFSRCPVLAVPSGLGDNGVPTGIQIVGRTYDDLTPFRLGAACEAARPWLDVPSRRPEIATANA